MSGCVALRRHLLPYRAGRDSPLYRAAIGGLVNARKVIEALAERRIDAGPLDSYFHDLLRAGEPDFAAQVRVVATTAAAPVPPLVATAPLEPAELGRLRAVFQEAGREAALAPQRATLLLAGFVLPESSDYDVFDGILAEAAQFPGTW